MSTKTLDPPRVGFYIIVASYFAAGAFLWFGARQPRLDDAFEILAQRERGNFTAYTEEDLTVLDEVLRDYPGIVRDMVGRSTARFLEPGVNDWFTLLHGHLVVRPDKGK